MYILWIGLGAAAWIFMCVLFIAIIAGGEAQERKYGGINEYESDGTYDEEEEDNEQVL